VPLDGEFKAAEIRRHGMRTLPAPTGATNVGPADRGDGTPPASAWTSGCSD
jgi:hypothetical protein